MQTSIYLSSSPEVEGVSGKVRPRCRWLNAPAGPRCSPRARPKRPLIFRLHPCCPPAQQYFDKCRPVTSSKESYDAEVARRLWDASAELVGLDKLGLA